MEPPNIAYANLNIALQVLSFIQLGGSHDCFPSSRLRPGRMGTVKLIREALKHLIQEMATEWAPIQYRSQRDEPRWYPR